MKKYLLLRNNKQTGPFSYDELLEMGLKSQDLLWVDGKSASWRYPGEFDEFKTHPSLQKEQIPDRSFTEVQNDILLYRPELNIPVHTFPVDELIEFPTMARFLDPETDRNSEPVREKITSTSILPVQSGIPEEIPEIKPIFEDQLVPYDEKAVSLEITDPIDTIDEIKSTHIIGAEKSFETGFPSGPEDIPEAGNIAAPEKEIPAIAPKRVSVTLPAAVSNNTFVVIQPKAKGKMPALTRDIKTVPIPAAAMQNPVIKETEAETIPVAMEEKYIPSLPEIKRDNIAEKVVATENIQAGKKVEEPPVVYMPATQTASGNLLQKLAVAAGIISIIAVAGLIANSIFNPDAYNYTVNKKPAAILPVTVEQAPDTQETLSESVNESAVPSNTNLQEIVSINSTQSKAGVKTGKTAPKQTKADDPAVVPGNLGAAENKVNANVTPVSNEEKTPAVDPREDARKNISKLVHYELNNYKVNAFGGVSNFEVVINNNSAYPLDLVVVELKYIQSNKKIFKTERLEFKGVAPNGKQSIGVAKTNRGIKVETTITSISSRELDLGYNQ